MNKSIKITAGIVPLLILPLQSHASPDTLFNSKHQLAQSQVTVTQSHHQRHGNLIAAKSADDKILTTSASAHADKITWQCPPEAHIPT